MDKLLWWLKCEEEKKKEKKQQTDVKSFTYCLVYKDNKPFNVYKTEFFYLLDQTWMLFLYENEKNSSSIILPNVWGV